MTRKNLKQLTLLRLREAKLLLDNQSYSGAYYLSGYSIEYALKACISRKIHASEIPDKKFISDCYTHNLKDLVKLAGLENDRATLERSSVNFASNWAIVKDWNEVARYKTFTHIQATELYTSITSRSGGILSWIRQYW
ncbi:MAG: HEPN domain-containing protein [Bacteroidota bacterium]|nr:HEPN domain-containing protein [Bacteroidota bacterium]